VLVDSARIPHRTTTTGEDGEHNRDLKKPHRPTALRRVEIDIRPEGWDEAIGGRASSSPNLGSSLATDDHRRRGKLEFDPTALLP
jgi:hypothetical protein